MPKRPSSAQKSKTKASASSNKKIATITPSETDGLEIKQVSRNHNPVPWVDLAEFTTREDGSDYAMLAFFTYIPAADVFQEASRVVMNKKLARDTVDLICKKLGYYPSRPEDDKD